MRTTTMNARLLDRKFRRMGARVKVETLDDRAARDGRRVSIDVRRDAEGEYFEVRVPGRDAPTVDAIDVRPRQRHLLLLVKDGDRAEVEKQKFLCGHDERAWFVAAVPEAAGVADVRTAMEALRPPIVRRSLLKHRVKPRDRDRRRNAGYIRQGEWFFLPEPGLRPPDALVLRDEPLRRGAGKPHRVQYLFRRGGVTVYVSRQHPNGLTEGQYRKFLQRHPKTPLDFTPMRSDMEVYAKGRVSHADHRTIVLPGWHRVVMNTETQARAMRSVAFLD
jgi:hypothetical protein